MKKTTKYWVVKNGSCIGKFTEKEAERIVSKDMSGEIEIIPEFDSNGKPTRIC